MSQELSEEGKTRQELNDGSRRDEQGTAGMERHRYLKLQLQPPIRYRLPQGYRERLIPRMKCNTALLYTYRWQALTLIMRARSGSGLPVLVPAILLWVWVVGQQKMRGRFCLRTFKKQVADERSLVSRLGNFRRLDFRGQAFTFRRPDQRAPVAAYSNSPASPGLRISSAAGTAVPVFVA